MIIILNVKQKFFSSVNQNRNLRDRWNWILEKWKFSVLKVFVLLPSPLGFIISRHGSLTPERTSGTTCQTALISSRWAVAMVTGPPVISRDVSAWNWNVKPPQKNRLSARGGNFYLLSSGADRQGFCWVGSEPVLSADSSFCDGSADEGFWSFFLLSDLIQKET